MQAGIPITLRFDRKETGECTSHVVFPDLGTDTMLPGNETTEMSLPPLPAGDYPFACGMNMVHGLLRVEGETDSATKPDDGTASTTAIPAGTPRMSAADALLAERQEAEERRQEIRHTGMLVAIGTVLTLPVFVPMMLMLVSHSLVPSWLMNPWLQAILITPVMFYCGAPIHRVGWPALWHRSPDMNSLVALHHRRIPVQHRLVLRLGADARGVERALLRVGRRSDHARSGRTPVGGESP